MRVCLVAAVPGYRALPPLRPRTHAREYIDLDIDVQMYVWIEREACIDMSGRPSHAYTCLCETSVFVSLCLCLIFISAVILYTGAEALPCVVSPSGDRGCGSSLVGRVYGGEGTRCSHQEVLALVP